MRKKTWREKKTKKNILLLTAGLESCLSAPRINTRLGGSDLASRRSVTAYACACLLREAAYEMRPAPKGASLASSSSAAVGGSTAESSGSGVSGSDGSPRGLTSPTRSGATATAALRPFVAADPPPPIIMPPPNSLPPRGLTRTETAS